MKCSKCEQENKIYKGSPKIFNGDYKVAWKKLDKSIEYLTSQCETKTQLKPVKLASVTRYRCSNKHEWSITHE